MKKLSSLIALGIACSMAIAKPAVNTATFGTYSQQMQEMSAKYITEKQFSNANKTVEVWLNSYNLLSKTDKVAYAPVYAAILYHQACALAQTNDLYAALKALKEAAKSGFNNSEQAKNDPNLSPLKAYDEFNRIINSMKS